ncbi:MAG: hypothetical protein J7647_26400 [Cyanobacteria bacterium SBLK]|nr:hypothetical protein [Cyanobacteria bacterium SBLK]
MTNTPFVPNPEKVRQTLSKVHTACQQMEIAGLELQEVIYLLEQNLREQRLKRLKKVSV